MVKKGQKDIFSSQFFTRKSLEVFLDHLRLKTKFCKKCPIFDERVPYQKKGFLYFWKAQTEWFFPKFDHVFEIWQFEKLCYIKPDFSWLSKQLRTKISKSVCRTVSTVAAEKTHFNATFHQTASKNLMYFLSYIKILILEIITWMYMHMMCRSIGLMTSFFTPKWPKNIKFFTTWTFDCCLQVKV